MLSDMKNTHCEPPATARQPINRAWPCGRHGETPTVLLAGAWRASRVEGGVNRSESSAHPGAGRGTGWEDGITVEAQWLDEPTRKRGVHGGGTLLFLCASQRRGLPAGPPWDLASLSLREHLGGDCRRVWTVQLGSSRGGQSCRRQAAGRNRDSHTWVGGAKWEIFFFPLS